MSGDGWLLATPLPPTDFSTIPSFSMHMQAFMAMEKLDGSEAYKCEGCKRTCPHTKRLQIYRPPRVLVLTLKRFAQRAAGGSLFSRFRCVNVRACVIVCVRVSG